MTFGKTALRCWLPAAALLLALLCPLPVAAARAGTAIPVSVRTDGAAADAVYTVELTPLDAAPAPVQCALTVKNGGTVYFTGFAFDEPGDYRYLVAERSGGAAQTTYDAHSYTVTVRVTGRPDGGLAAGLWAVRSGKPRADGVLLARNRHDPPETAAAAVTASAAMTGTRTVKAAAPAALPQTGDGFPIEALAAAFCASVIALARREKAVNPLTAAPEGRFLWQQKKAWQGAAVAACSGTITRGCTPLRTNKEVRAGAKRTYYCPFLTPPRPFLPL